MKVMVERFLVGDLGLRIYLILDDGGNSGFLSGGAVFEIGQWGYRCTGL